MISELKDSIHKNVTENGHCDHVTECTNAKSNGIVDDASYVNSENIPHERSKVPTDLHRVIWECEIM
jgi:hypothetical protein